MQHLHFPSKLLACTVIFEGLSASFSAEGDDCNAICTDLGYLRDVESFAFGVHKKVDAEVVVSSRVGHLLGDLDGVLDAVHEVADVDRGEELALLLVQRIEGPAALVPLVGLPRRQTAKNVRT